MSIQNLAQILGGKAIHLLGAKKRYDTSEDAQEMLLEFENSLEGKRNPQSIVY